jgi:predicted dehydrogenase
MDNNENKPASGLPTRREFIKKTTAVAAVAATTNLFKTPVYGQTQAPSPGRVIGANDRITVGIIGLGVGIGQNHLEGIGKNAGDNNTAIAGVCDLFSLRRDWGKKQAALKDEDVFTDYRRMLDRKDIDSVVIATHDPWHAPITIAAVESGKHVYCEKPMSRYLAEAFGVYEAVKRTGKTFQIGSQGCSAGGWQKCAELVSGGKIGTLVWSQGYYCRNSIGGEWNSSPFKMDVVSPDLVVPGSSSAANIDWDTWQHPVHNKIPFNADHFHRWRKYYPYCAGVLGDLAPHRMHPLMMASGNPEFPSRVTCIGTKNVHADTNTPDTVERDVPEHQQLLAEFPSGYLITLTCGTVNAKSPGFVVYGHKATLDIGESGNRIELIPEREFSEDIDPATFDGMQREDIRVHEKNFFDCIRSGKPTNANVDLAVRVATVLSLAEMSNRLNMMCLFDDKTRKITDGNGKEVEAITYGTLPLS